ncbi:MAG: hypothetical protein IT430_20030 [Phycisphaerales bacterium]|nr:hypothetical protein [Phycisphaerales bacterium]
MNIMLRWALRIAIFLLLGAIVNVAVAWGCALLHGPATGRYVHDPREERRVLWINRRFGHMTVSGFERSGSLLYQDPDSVKQYRGDVWWRTDDVFPIGWSFAIASGWPRLSMTGRVLLIDDLKSVDEVQWVIQLEDKMPLPDAGQFLPLRPYWPGLASNTVFFAMLTWMITAVRIALRNRWRTERSQCPACGYPRGTSRVCTECGGPLPGVAAK